MLLPDAVKTLEHMKLVQRTLRTWGADDDSTLAPFRDLNDESIAGLAKAMGVYEFQDGDNATMQGNMHGTHFFIIVEGTFCVLKDDKCVNKIGAGALFGESVVLMSGAQNATVKASGRALAYGMTGGEVRKTLKQQYNEGRKDVFRIINDIC